MDLSRDQFRYFLKDAVRMAVDFRQTDQNRGVAPPPVQKPADTGRRVALAKPGAWTGIAGADLEDAIGRRRSRRGFRPEPLTLDELAFLLWATQGVRERASASTAFRTVPSAGCRHALETYLCVMNVTGLEPAVYRYLPLEHELLLVARPEELSKRVAEAALGQGFVGRAAATFIWTAVPYRMEWRYDLASAKVIAIDAGHVCQNLYLACEAVGAGTCAVAAYDQQLMDALVGADGQEEFVMYLAPVGKVD